MVTAGRPYYGRLADMDFAKIRDLIGEHLLLALYVARNAANKVRPGGTLIFMSGTGGRRPAIGMSIASAVTAALPALTANLALEIAPVRVNLIAAAARLAKRLNVNADRRTPRDTPADTKVFANTFVQLSRCNTSGLIVRKELR